MINRHKNELADLAPESNEPILDKPTVGQMQVAPRHKKQGKTGKVFVTILVIIILAAVVLFYLDSAGKINLLGKKMPAVSFKSTDWQAVFLSNGQVYFGHLKNYDSAYPELTDIYYLQVQNVPIQPAEAASQEAGVQPAEQTQQRLILVKFGTELHKPQDKMFINRDHILFYENLANDSPVVKSIEDYLNSLNQQ